MTNYLFLILIFLGALVPSGVWGGSDYIYRQRVNWVKLEKADSAKVSFGDIQHPSTSISTEQMEAMLLSIKISKKHLLKKEIDTVDVFNSWEARKFAPLLVEGLAKAAPEEVVNFAIVHKRPLFILRNDRLTVGNVFVASDGLHFQFTKLFAKLDGDYEASANRDKALRRAKTMRVNLEAHEGQMLSYTSATEIILNPTYDFIKNVQVEQAQREAEEAEAMKAKSERKKSKEEKTTAYSNADTAMTPVVKTSDSSQSGDLSDRLRRLEELKQQKLISDQEYQDLRKKILSEL